MTKIVTFEMWHLTHGMWYVTCDRCHVKHDTWHVTCDMWHETHGGRWTLFQSFSSLAIMVWEWSFVEYILQTWYSRGCSTNSVVIHRLIHSIRDLKFWENVYLPPHVLYDMSRVLCHMSYVPCHMSIYIYFYVFLYFFPGQYVEPSQWRVCYQRGLHCQFHKGWLTDWMNKWMKKVFV